MRQIVCLLRDSLFVLTILLVLSATGSTQPALSPLEKYRKLEFPPKTENFAKGCQERVALEYEIINTADRKALRSALKDENAYVRAMAARALGILGDKESADALAELVKSDKEYMVRLRAVESLGYLKLKPEAIELRSRLLLHQFPRSPSSSFPGSCGHKARQGAGSRSKQLGQFALPFPRVDPPSEDP